MIRCTSTCSMSSKINARICRVARAGPSHAGVTFRSLSGLPAVTSALGADGHADDGAGRYASSSPRTSSRCGTRPAPTPACGNRRHVPARSTAASPGGSPACRTEPSTPPRGGVRGQRRGWAEQGGSGRLDCGQTGDFGEVVGEDAVSGHRLVRWREWPPGRGSGRCVPATAASTVALMLWGSLCWAVSVGRRGG
jgi:hypothetical protein